MPRRGGDLGWILDLLHGDIHAEPQELTVPKELSPVAGGLVSTNNPKIIGDLRTKAEDQFPTKSFNLRQRNKYVVTGPDLTHEARDKALALNVAESDADEAASRDTANKNIAFAQGNADALRNQQYGILSRLNIPAGGPAGSAMLSNLNSFPQIAANQNLLEAGQMAQRQTDIQRAVEADKAAKIAERTATPDIDTAEKQAVFRNIHATDPLQFGLEQQAHERKMWPMQEEKENYFNFPYGGGGLYDLRTKQFTGVQGGAGEDPKQAMIRAAMQQAMPGLQLKMPGAYTYSPINTFSGVSTNGLTPKQVNNMPATQSNPLLSPSAGQNFEIIMYDTDGKPIYRNKATGQVIRNQ